MNTPTSTKGPLHGGQKFRASQYQPTRSELLDAIEAYVTARRDGGVSMADLSTIAHDKLLGVHSRASVMPKPSEQIEIVNGEFRCICGNTASADGFEACLPSGEICEPQTDSLADAQGVPHWEHHYSCSRCLRVINTDGQVEPLTPPQKLVNAINQFQGVFVASHEHPDYCNIVDPTVRGTYGWAVGTDGNRWTGNRDDGSGEDAFDLDKITPNDNISMVYEAVMLRIRDFASRRAPVPAPVTLDPANSQQRPALEMIDMAILLARKAIHCSRVTARTQGENGCLDLDAAPFPSLRALAEEPTTVLKS